MKGWQRKIKILILNGSKFGRAYNSKGFYNQLDL